MSSHKVNTAKTQADNSPSKKKNDKAWRAIFAKYDVLEKVNSVGLFEISAEQINEFREARLMTKFDHESNLPEDFTANKLSILPITRGSYVIGRFKAYTSIHYNQNIPTKIFEANPNLETIDYSNISSESAALNCAYVTDIISDLAGEPVLPTVSGRMSTKNFSFEINHDTGKYTININNSQCEIDGGYEGENVFIIIEAKNEAVTDFLTRQLYYPYRLWQNKIRKRVIPVFMTYSSDTFSFFKGEFQDINNYNSFKITEQHNYVISTQDNAITLLEIQDIANNSIIINEPNTPFPQADSFAKIFDLMTLLRNNSNTPLSKDFVTANYAFVERQTMYYVAGARYLGLMNSNNGYYTLTQEGIKTMALPHKQKILKLIDKILSHGVFNKVFKLYIKQAGYITKEDIVTIMATSSIRNISKSTIGRRAQSVKKWIEWIVERVEE